MKKSQFSGVQMYKLDKHRTVISHHTLTDMKSLEWDYIKADLSLCWGQRPNCEFCLEVANYGKDLPGSVL